jgi:hypothetical protein
MSVFDFPANPQLNDVYQLGQYRYKWNGKNWQTDDLAVGFTGSSGGTGFTGSQGEIGFTGSQGPTGFTGSRGTLGFTGSQGDIGFTGSSGGTGFTGSAGDLGYTGSQGTTGFTGSMGPPGSGSGVNKFNQTIGDGINKSFTVTHNLNESNLVVSVRDNISNYYVYPDIIYNNSNSIIVSFYNTPSTDQYMVIVV